MMVNPTTPEFKRLRSIWWGLLGGGLVLTTVSWAMREYLVAPWAITASNVVLGLAYACIFYALYLDWTKMRPMRQIAYRDGATTKPAKVAKGDGTKAAKADNAGSTDKQQKAEKAADTADSSDTTGE